MKRGFIILLICIFLFPVSVLAEEVHIYLFYGNTCPICEREREFLESLKFKYDNIQIFEFETYENEENAVYMQSIKDMYQISGGGVPFTVVGDVAVYGFSDSLSNRVESLVKKYQSEDYYDRVGVFLGLFEDEEIIVSTTDDTVSRNIQETPKKSHSLSIFWIILFSFTIGIILLVKVVFQQKKFHKN